MDSRAFLQICNDVFKLILLLIVWIIIPNIPF